jgi:hypothetical protein
VSDRDDTTSNLGLMFLCVVAGYGLAQYQQSRREQKSICYQPVTNTATLPEMFADKAEEVIRAGGQAGIRKIGSLLELIVQTATGDTKVFRQSVNAAEQAYTAPESTPPPASTQAGTRDNGVEYYDNETGTWRPL